MYKRQDIDDTNRNNLLPIINDLETTINVINSDVSPVIQLKHHSPYEIIEMCIRDRINTKKWLF